MRVAYVSTKALSHDGWGRYTVELALGAKARGIEPVLITATPDLDPGLADCEHYPILPELFGGRFTTPRTLLKFPELRWILKTVDLVHCPVELYAPMVALARPKYLPFVLSVFGTWAIRPLEERQRFLFEPAFRSADVVLAISDFTRRWMADLMELPRTEVLPGGVHPEKFVDPVTDVDMPEWIGKEPVIFSVGAVKPRKGQHIALEALAIAREQIPNLHYAMAGSLTAAGTYVQGLRDRAEELGISESVHFLGQLPPYGALTAWFQQASAFILPSVNQGSSFEGLGFVFLEAGAAGTPSIGTLNCGAEEAIIDGKTGYLVPQDDPEATAEAIVRLLMDETKRKEMGEAARQRAHELSWDQLADRIVEIYRELAGNR